MTLDEAQDTVDAWIKRYGVRYFSELTNLALLMEETGELAKAMAQRFGEQSPKPGGQMASVEEELADVLFVLICLANQTGINLEEALKKSIEKKTVRDKTRHLGNEKLSRNSS